MTTPTIRSLRPALRTQLATLQADLVARSLASDEQKWGAHLNAFTELADWTDQLLGAAHAASHALRSYQHGNAATELAKSIADQVDVAIGKPPAAPPITTDEMTEIIRRWLIVSNTTASQGCRLAAEEIMQRIEVTNAR